MHPWLLAPPWPRVKCSDSERHPVHLAEDRESYLHKITASIKMCQQYRSKSSLCFTFLKFKQIHAVGVHLNIRETLKPNLSGYAAKILFNSVLLPTPEGPNITTARFLALADVAGLMVENWSRAATTAMVLVGDRGRCE